MDSIMARQDINRSFEMAVFAAVVEAGAFSAAARRLELTPSAVSKLVNRLEARLGTRLLQRSTRQLHTTPEGDAFYVQCKRILDDINSAEREAAHGAAPRGRLRINCFVPFGVHYLLPILPEFSERYPDILLDVVVSDAVVDLLEDRTDIAIRTGRLKESNLVARKLGEDCMIVAASPAYLARHGTPRTPQELTGHKLLGFNFRHQKEAWPFRDGAGGNIHITPQGGILVSDGESMRQLALAGMGLGRFMSQHVRDDIAQGRLVPLLEDYSTGDGEIVHAVFMGPGLQVPARVRVMLDFLLEKVTLSRPC
ncbi:LysR family transcriptional regulator [Janthinobacterium sp.]|uniref:LysR family transcriptional regulator n=1 Tax=Janthinobacterium sp. TaxID=1871054 RepID=UPI0026230FB9|nr:LysR family transcriptional regulator [Janthinobacterium sp.]